MKVRIQDIANQAGLSRNTVSKILNDKYKGPDETKSLVLRLAREMGYRDVAGLEKAEVPVRNILILSVGNVITSGFFSHTIQAIQTQMDSQQYTILLGNVTENAIQSRQLPASLTNNEINGIICLELFDKIYIKELLSLNIPIVFIEFYHDPEEISGSYDVVIMDNSAPIKKLTSSLIQRGYERFAFWGDIRHCLGFRERFQGMCSALNEYGLKYHLPSSFMEEDGNNYYNINYLAHFVQNLQELPQVIVCANDFLARKLIAALSLCHLSVPKDIKIIGYDNSYDASSMEPQLTTVHVYKEDIGQCAVTMLRERIENPKLHKRITHVESLAIERESTEE